MRKLYHSQSQVSAPDSQFAMIEVLKILVKVGIFIQDKKHCYYYYCYQCLLDISCY